MNKKIVHDALILFAFTIVLGFVLGFVYDLTKDKIAEREQQTAEEAYKNVFSTADAFEPVDFDKDEAASIISDGGYKDNIDNIQKATDASGNVLGYVITVVAKDGSQGAITLSVGIMSDGTVNGYAITKTSETPGLGLKAKEPEFSSQFENKKVDKFEVVKREAASDNEIEAITASTITSRAVANGCNAAILYFNEKLGGAQ